MFKKARNLDEAFRQVRLFSGVMLVLLVFLCGYISYRSYQAVARMQDKIYVLANGKAVVAYASAWKDNLAVEARDHVKTFHQQFFTLTPDDALIDRQLNEALYMADASAKQLYDDLRESNYYTGIISGNVSQRVETDSIVLDLERQPIGFMYYGKEILTRPTSMVTRSLVTSGNLRQILRSDRNPHGFLIERWKVMENKDLSAKRR